MRKVLAAAAAIAALTGGAMAFIYVTTGDAPPAGKPPAEPMVAPPPPEPPPEPYAGVRNQVDTIRNYGAPPPVPEAPVIEVAPAPPPAPPGSWEALPAVALSGLAAPERMAIRTEMAQIGTRLSACYRPMTQARSGSDRITMTSDATNEEDSSAPVLVLYLESRDGEMTIVDAPLQSRGDATDALISCAQRVLRGHSFLVRGAKAGTRKRVRYPLIP